MSSEASAPGNVDDVTGTERDQFPEPRAHGAAVMNHFSDLEGKLSDPSHERGTLYDQALAYWREHIGDPENQPYLAVEDFDAGWLGSDRQHAIVAKSSGWKAGYGHGDDYTQYYEQHLMLREVREDENGELELTEPALSANVNIQPQFRDMVYKSGDALECPYGDGTRVVCQTTWAEDPYEIERRMYDILRAVYGPDVIDLDDRVHDARRAAKAEAHIRFRIGKKAAAIETIEQSKQLVAWGGEAEIDAYQKRIQEGWLEARVSNDRWHLLGFDHQPFDTEVKLYQAAAWFKKPKTSPYHHPKLEASFDGVNEGKLPHIEQWDEIMDYLRNIVATHARWAGIERSDLVADDFFDGPHCAPYEFEKPTGRRRMLRRRYEDLATDIYREALKESTTSVYDILRVIAEHDGATYDELEERTGLARSTIRYHVARLAESGVVKRLSNPVLVVFVSQVVLERAREILREVRPEDMADDMDARAEERRERREERSETDSDQEDSVDETASDAASDPDEIGFRYLSELAASIHDVAHRVDRDELDDRDVRVRADELPPPLR
ncbi:hypothetical protein C479_14183 [Halovivax asiaticus JCM 14624]|uniref:HTH marR-type domain-containing protein n=1 Tax=Halovivax asiaticus JCM 14624 TaxID=1227490 RepID=M0BFV1_9EURY|nr:winged helix-turn-helix domain-containing protein [Halovivax asiaticus]ELZ08494.1 hypothetical protein C479_14183 [Halovivax asiaticus JCM 14624]